MALRLIRDGGRKPFPFFDEVIAREHNDVLPTPTAWSRSSSSCLRLGEAAQFVSFSRLSGEGGIHSRAPKMMPRTRSRGRGPKVIELHRGEGQLPRRHQRKD